MAADYGGDVTPDEAMAILKGDKSAVLVDVRTQPECLDWQSYPSMALNPAFLPRLEAALEERGSARDAPVLFLCRSGARSKAAAQALTAAGYSRCLNIAGGFEGGPDPSRHRGLSEGWKARSLPWVQP